MSGNVYLSPAGSGYNVTLIIIIDLVNSLDIQLAIEKIYYEHKTIFSYLVF